MPPLRRQELLERHNGGLDCMPRNFVCIPAFYLRIPIFPEIQQALGSLPNVLDVGEHHRPRRVALYSVGGLERRG